jgi:hypothetical protein
MTEAEWLVCADPTPMLDFLRGKVSDRKLRLFACACCRRIWHLFSHQDSFKSIEVGERFAEGEATDEELRLADELAMWAGDDASWRSMQKAAIAWAAAAPVQKNGSSAAQSAVFELQRVFAGNEPKCDEERVAQCMLIREIFDNPFRPAGIVPAYLAWKDGPVVKLAQGIYDERVFDRLPVLADALEDAGCTSQEILSHLRQSGVHVKGCWALDLVLGKE